jgi:hypothetical protein
VFIPLLLVGLALTYTRFFGRVWEWVAVAIAAATLLFWVFYVARISTLPAEYGYIGVILITAFTYTLLQLRFVLVVLISVIGIAAYLPYAVSARYIVPVSLVLATLLVARVPVSQPVSKALNAIHARGKFVLICRLHGNRRAILSAL